MKSIIIVHGPRGSGKTFIAKALADANTSAGEKVVTHEVCSLHEVKKAVLGVPDNAVAIFVCGPNFVFDPKDVRPPITGFLSVWKVYANHYVDR